MAIAPLIKPVRLAGGTFYTFSSASEDLGMSFNTATKKFRFSKFALLNLPDIQANTTNYENLMQFRNVPGAFGTIDGTKTWNDYFAESFQNYCLNLEALITALPGYDPNADRTVTERVFFKWLKEIGAIRFRQSIPAEQSSTTYGTRFVEEDVSDTYKKVIQYIGDINVVNSVRNNFNAYSEVYIHVPTSHGSSPAVLFDTIADANYYPSAAFTNEPVNPLAAEYLVGRDASTVQPANLSTLAHYDSDTSGFFTPDPNSLNADFYYFNAGTNAFELWHISPFPTPNPDFFWWYSNPIPNTYFTEPSGFANPQNDIFKIESVNGDVEFKRSRLDGISLEFNTDVYTGIANDPAIANFGEFSESFAAQNFEFNAVMVYYDLYDPNIPTNFTTNLFGILVLDNVDPLPAGGGYIPRLTKYKPNAITGANGNSYAFKINLKFDINSQDVSVEKSINDYNTFSLDLFLDALNGLKASTSLLESNQNTVQSLKAQVAALQDLVINTDNYAEINARLTEIETALDNSAAVYANNQNLLNLIDRNYQEINNIYNNFTSVAMSYNIDLLKEGSGIFLDKTVPGEVKVNNQMQLFNIGVRPLVSIVGDFLLQPTNYRYIHKLSEFTNYLKVTDGSVGVPYNLDRDVIIYVDDTDIKWKKGQGLRLSFQYGIDMSNTNGNFNLIIYSDALDTLNTGFPYNAEIAYVPYSEFELKDNRPTIELICLDPDTYTFAVDIF
jgi:hypothetical protein